VARCTGVSRECNCSTGLLFCPFRFDSRRNLHASVMLEWTSSVNYSSAPGMSQIKSGTSEPLTIGVHDIWRQML